MIRIMNIKEYLNLSSSVFRYYSVFIFASRRWVVSARIFYSRLGDLDIYMDTESFSFKRHYLVFRVNILPSKKYVPQLATLYSRLFRSIFKMRKKGMLLSQFLLFVGF